MPYVPKPKTKQIPCDFCHEPITVGWKTRTPKRHPECSEERLQTNIREIAAKEGPAYERWLAAMQKWAINLNTGVGVPPRNNDSDRGV